MKNIKTKLALGVVVVIAAVAAFKFAIFWGLVAVAAFGGFKYLTRNKA